VPVLETPYFLTALVSLGMAWSFFLADPDSRTSRALSLALAMIGLAIIANNYGFELALSGPLPAWTRWLVVPEIIAFCAVFEWVLRVRRTIPAGELRTLFGDKALRIAQLLIVCYGIAAVRYPDVRMREFFGGINNPLDWSRQVVLLFAAPMSLAMLLWAGSIALCLNRRPDPAERTRLIAFLLACPIIVSGLVLPRSIAPTTTVLGLTVLLVGAMRHAQLHGRRGLFMSRFLSPQVASLVNTEGLRGVMRDTVQDLSVVCCDLRGFTAFAAAHSSDQIIQLLREYYDAVGAAVVDVEGTIKDYAGDGVLILVGAPVPVDDHADRAVRLAQRIRELVGEVIVNWNDGPARLGIGVGVASGPVTVGVVGGESRLEYAAVGQAVNLAARLCARAGAGEILLDPGTAALAETARVTGFAARPPIALKGFPEPVAALVDGGR
jgi:class 3 adenylate cyclase